VSCCLQVTCDPGEARLWKNTKRLAAILELHLLVDYMWERADGVPQCPRMVDSRQAGRQDNEAGQQQNSHTSRKVRGEGLLTI
jgi:hypothetical protein